VEARSTVEFTDVRTGISTLNMILAIWGRHKIRVSPPSEIPSDGDVPSFTQLFKAD